MAGNSRISIRNNLMFFVFVAIIAYTTAVLIVHYNYRDNDSSRNKEPYTVEGTRDNKYL